jgi:site-specific recombinase XerC
VGETRETKAVEQLKWRAGSSFLLSLRGPLCRFVAPAAQSQQLHRSNTKAIPESELGQITVRPYRCVDGDYRVCGMPTDKRHSHVSKHSLASHRLAGNCNLALIKQQFGHASISSTLFNTGTSDQQWSEVASAVPMAKC